MDTPRRRLRAPGPIAIGAGVLVATIAAASLAFSSSAGRDPAPADGLGASATRRTLVEAAEQAVPAARRPAADPAAPKHPATPKPRPVRRARLAAAKATTPPAAAPTRREAAAAAQPARDGDEREHEGEHEGGDDD